MTTGNKTSGFKQAVVVNGSATFLYTDYKTRVWSGGNRPLVPYKVSLIVETKPVTTIRVRKGVRYVDIKYVQRIYKKRTRPSAESRGADTPNAYSTEVNVINDNVLEYKFPLQTVWSQGTGQSSGLGPAGASFNWNANDDLALIGKLRERIAGSDFNAGVALAESKPALKMITDSARRIYGAYAAARKGNLSKARRILVNGTDRKNLGRKSTASNWLELQYGWLPLLKDVEGAAQFLAQHFEVPLEQRYQARSSKRPGTITSSAPTNSTLVKSEAWSRGQIVCYLKEKDVVALSGLTDPLSVAWELVPYSFVLDWFLPIGNYLSARGLAQSLSGTFVTTRKNYTYSMGLRGTVNLSIRNASKIGRERLTISRTVSTALAIPQPCIKPLKEVDSWKRAANAVALLTMRT